MKISNNFTDWIIFENDDLLVVNKPAFVPSVPERGKITNASILELANQTYGDCIMCHRLDRETSGALVVAKNAEAYRHISIQFEKRQVKKVYHAIVEGRIFFDHFEVNIPINTDDLKHIHIDRKNGKLANTFFHTLETFKHFTLMECMPVTGRLHQIRVHLASQNARIAGDHMYGGRDWFLSEIKKKFKGEDKPMIARFALHAKSINFQLPQGEQVTIEANYANDFEVFLKLIKKYDAVK
jgi:23S rRNA pseudouridine955/2504/2580 synthase